MDGEYSPELDPECVHYRPIAEIAMNQNQFPYGVEFTDGRIHVLTSSKELADRILQLLSANHVEPEV